MKVIIAAILLSLVATTLQAQKEFVIRVKLNNPKNYPLNIYYYTNDDNFVTDSNVIIDEGYRIFKGKIILPQIVYLGVRNDSANIWVDGGFMPAPRLQMVVEGGAELIVEGDAEKPWLATVRSSNREAYLWEEFRTKNKLWEDSSWAVAKEAYLLVRDTALFTSTIERSRPMGDSMMRWQKEFVLKYPNSFAALHLFADYAPELNAEEMTEQFEALGDKHKATPLGKYLASKVAALAVTKVGKKMIPFSQVGHDGRVVNISSLKGKYVLLDFWGSWCGPCRATHPHLKEIYKRYKQQGFEIVGIAAEQGDAHRQDSAWHKAIASDGINWLHVLNDPSKMDIVDAYGVSAFPTKILLGKDGTILFREVGDNEGVLDDKLKELFGK